VSNIGLDRALLALTRVTGHPQYRDFVVDVLKIDASNPSVEAGTDTADNHAYHLMSHCLARLDLYAETGNPELLITSRRVMEFLRRDEGLLVTGSCSQWECFHDTQSGGEHTMETCAPAYLARLLEALLRLEGDSLYGASWNARPASAPILLHQQFQAFLGRFAELDLLPLAERGGCQSLQCIHRKAGSGAWRHGPH